MWHIGFIAKAKKQRVAADVKPTAGELNEWAEVCGKVFVPNITHHWRLRTHIVVV